MYRKQVRRRRAVLVLLVVVSLVLLSTHFSEGSGGPLHGVQRGVATVLGPLEEGADRALKPVRDMSDWFGETFDARGENEELRDEVADLRQRVAKAESAVGENKELRDLVKLGPAGGIQGRQAVAARVIGRSPTVWYSTVTIDRGSSSGVGVNDPVITGDGLAGRITDTDIDEDQMVVTSGWRAGHLTSLFPAGIEIGKVTEATVDEQETYQRVHVRPFVDLREMEIVQVLTEPGRADGQSQAATGDTG